MAIKSELKKLEDIENIFQNDLNREMNLMVKMKSYLKVRSESLHRIQAYKNEYGNDANNKHSKSVPALMRNLSDFLKKLDTIILEERANIDKINLELSGVMKRIHEFEAKIKAISIKRKSIELELRIRHENEEASIMNEMTTQSRLRK